MLSAINMKYSIKEIIILIVQYTIFNLVKEFGVSYELGSESKLKQITKAVRISKHRVFHHADIYSLSEINNEFTVLLRDAFNTVVKGPK
ncbi:MAG: hypothetical protein L3J41_13825 [Melioribacteraceae bacterium]|nr:hypothetical protein [Melioribacteraceae bacterium]